MSRSTAFRTTFAALAILFFTAPIVARVVVVPEKFENRNLASAPKPSQGWEAFAQTSRYVVDHMPLRAQAVRLNTRIWTDVFGTDPSYDRDETLGNDQALPFAGVGAQERDEGERQGGPPGPVTASTGREGWLFQGSETQFACADKMQDSTILKRWAAVVEATRQLGPTATMFAAPSKSSVYPEYLPEDDSYKECALREKDKFWKLLASEGPGLGVIELRSELVRLKQRAGDELFELTDTHWTTLGALTLVAATLEEVGDGIQIEADEVVRRQEEVTYTGDLSTAAGRAETAKRIEYDIVRDRDAPRVPGRTLLVCDSFAYRKMHVFEPYFESINYISLYTPSSEILRAIRRADHVIFEAGETNMESFAELMAWLAARLR